jgi:hypothetical protein
MARQTNSKNRQRLKSLFESLMRNGPAADAVVIGAFNGRAGKAGEKPEAWVIASEARNLSSI